MVSICPVCLIRSECWEHCLCEPALFISGARQRQGDYLCSTVALLSTLPLPPVELSLKRHAEDSHAKRKQGDVMKSFPAKLCGDVVALCGAGKKEVIIFQTFKDNTLS